MKAGKKFFSIVAVLLLITMMPISALAAEETPKAEPIRTGSILLDTNNPDIGIELYAPIGEPSLYAYSSTSDSGSGRFYLKSTNDTLAEFKVTGKFTYDGTICNVTDCTTSVWNVADGWRVSDSGSKDQVSPTLAKAVGVFELYKEKLFGDSLSSSATITVSCTHKGNTNVEFNGDEAN